MSAKKDDEGDYNWDDLNRTAKDLEKSIDHRFALLGHRFHELRRSQSGGGGDALQEQCQLGELEVEMKRLDRVIGMMCELLDQLSESKGAGRNASHLLNRHREIYQEYRKDMAKLRTQITRNMEQAELLHSVREEIDAYKGPQDQQQYYGREQSRIGAAQQNTDHVIEVAQGAHSHLMNQKSTLSSTYRRLQDAAERFPVINQVMMKIRVRRRRDQVILGTIIALCIFIFFL